MAEIFGIANFRGMNQSLIFGTNKNETRSLNGVKIRHGKVIGAGGMSKLLSIATTSATNIMRLMTYSGSDGNVTLLRITPTAVHKLNTGTVAWDTITGTALTAEESDHVRWTMHKGVLTFTNTDDRPRKWAGSGNTAVLGGTPPYAVCIADYMGFLFLGNISSDGSTFYPRRVNYSDDYDVVWGDCTGNELNFEESAGEIRELAPLGRRLNVFKSDAICYAHFVGGAIRFNQGIYPFDQGILAPRSLKTVGNAAQIMLGTDLKLHTISEQGIKELPPNVIDKLQTTMNVGTANYAFGCVDETNDIYYLFYPESTNYSVGRIGYNFRTGEFFHRRFAGHSFADAVSYRATPTTAEVIVAASTTLVYKIDSTDSIDETTAVSRFYDTDWQTFQAEGNKYLRSVNITFKRTPKVRVKVSIAYDFDETFRYEKSFDLKGKNGEETTVIKYDPPQDVKAHAFNIRIRFYHESTNVAEMRAILFHWDRADATALNLHEKNQINGAA
jgi:hypothetical protein